MHDRDPATPLDWREALAALPLEAAPPGTWDALSKRLDARHPPRAAVRLITSASASSGSPGSWRRSPSR